MEASDEDRLPESEILAQMTFVWWLCLHPQLLINSLQFIPTGRYGHHVRCSGAYLAPTGTPPERSRDSPPRTHSGS